MVAVSLEVVAVVCSSSISNFRSREVIGVVCVGIEGVKTGKHSTDALPSYPGGQVHLTLCSCAVQRADLAQLLVQRSMHMPLTQICACVQLESTVQ